MFRRAFLGSLLLALGACASLPQSTGGVSKDRLDALTARMQVDVQNGQIPGAVMLVARNGTVSYFEAVGKRDPKSGAPMTKDAVFRIYSMTKPIVTAGAMMLVEEGRIQLSDPVSAYLPELKGMKVGVEKAGTLELVDATREMTIQDLMRHTSGLTYGFFGKSLVKEQYNKADVDVGVARDDYLKVVSKLPLHYQPGSTWDYSISIDVLAYVIERVSGQRIEDYLQRRIFGPLGMKDTSFSIDEARYARLAQAFDSDPGVKGVSNWDNVRDAARRPSGGGGLLSTAEDYLRFAQMLVNGGELNGTRILARKTVEYMDSDHLGSVRGPLYLPGAGYTFGLGGAVRLSDGMAATPGSVGEFNWGGYGGTYFWVDPKEKLVGVLMIQSPSQRNYYRQLFRSWVYGALQ
jgi:CubicO group peptidase (beta-lactamase class C family)